MRLLVWNKGAVRTAGQLAFLTLLAAMTVQPASAQDGSGSKASCFKIVSVAETQRQTIRLNSCTGESWLLSRTASGRDFYAVGDNLAAARQLGVAVNRTRMLAFTLNGMLAACAGIVFAAQIGFVPNQTGSGLEKPLFGRSTRSAGRSNGIVARRFPPTVTPARRTMRNSL